LEQYELISRVEADLSKREQAIREKERELREVERIQLTRDNSFEVLPDRSSDDERLKDGSLKRFTINTASGRSLLTNNTHLEDNKNSIRRQYRKDQ
jgi:hypothetical protein